MDPSFGGLQLVPNTSTVLCWPSMRPMRRECSRLQQDRNMTFGIPCSLHAMLEHSIGIFPACTILLLLLSNAR